MGCSASANENNANFETKQNTTTTANYVYKSPIDTSTGTPQQQKSSTSPSKKHGAKDLGSAVDTNLNTTKLSIEKSVDGSIIKEYLRNTAKPAETKLINQYICMSSFPIGTGTSAKVYVCKDIGCSRLVAMKVVNKKLLTQLSQNFEATYLSDGFKREVAVLKRLSHENIARLYEVIDDTKHNLLYLAMEYFDGGDLGDSFAPTPAIAEKQAKLWTIQILEALRYCHNNSVVHRDLKTENILKSKDGNHIALVDFGMSHMWGKKQLEDENTKLNSNTKKDKLTKAMGTYLYFAPEMVKNKYGANNENEKRKKRKSVSFHGKPLDIWAFGVVLYKLLRGMVPYFNENRVETLRLIANADPINDLDLTSGFSNELSSFIKEVLNPKPARRPTAEEALKHEWLRETVKTTPLKQVHTSIIDNELNDGEMDQAVSTLSFGHIVMLKTKVRRLAIKARERIKAREHAAVKMQVYQYV